MTDQPTCKQRIKHEFAKEITTLRELWKVYTEGGPEAETEDGQKFKEYGLSFDYVAPGSFRDQKRGYFRYQISWGGPSDEFRFYTDERLVPERIEYWFMDWFDGACVTMRQGKNFDLLNEIFSDWRECGTVEYAYKQAMKE